MTPSRRDFLKGAVGGAGALLVGKVALGEGSVKPAVNIGPISASSAPAVAGSSGIDHVVVVMMENRSFDHFLGWMPNANGRQAGLSYADPSGDVHGTWHATQPNGCGFSDPDHSYEGGRQQLDGGAMDGFLTDKAYDIYAISYYEAADRPFMSQLALNYTTCDSYFCSILGPTYPNRMFQHAAATDRLDNTTTTSLLPTIWDQLNRVDGPT